MSVKLSKWDLKIESKICDAIDDNIYIYIYILQYVGLPFCPMLCFCKILSFDRYCF